MMNENFQKLVVRELKTILTPLIFASQESRFRNQLFTVLGWKLKKVEGLSETNLVESLEEISAAVEGIIELVENPPENITEFEEALSTIKLIFTSIEEIKNLAGIDAPAEFEKIASDLVNFLFVYYLEMRAPILHELFVLLTIIEPSHQGYRVSGVVQGDTIIRKPANLSVINFDRIVELVKDPVDTLRSYYFPESGLLTSEDSTATADLLFPRVAILLQSLGFSANYGFPSSGAGLVDDTSYELSKTSLRISYKLIESIDIGAILSLSSLEEGNLGLVFTPFGEFNLSKDLGNWLLESSMSLGIEGFGIGPEGLTLPGDFENTSIDANLALRKGDTNNAAFLVGSTLGTHLKIGGFELLGSLNYGDRITEYKIQLDLQNAALVISPGDGDGFLAKILPDEGIIIEFGLLFGWSSLTGFYFEGSGSMELEIPVHKSILGVIDIETVLIGIKAGEEGIQIYGAINSGLSMGPFKAVINEMGLSSNINFVEEGGNMGIMDASIRFKPPSGIGLSIKSSAVSGGGFLFFNFEEEKYAGVAELSIKDKVSLKVIGILTTKLPGKDEGYSLLLIVTAEFSPISLAFGFTLNGVGGLVGLHRSMNLQALRDGVKNNSIDNVMFPDDPVANAAQIISDLETIFPIQEGRYTFGIMGLIGWGAPTLITIELGLMLEVPKPVRLAILGVVKAIIPTEDESLLKIQINFVGTIDFEAKYITFDASIFDSKFVKFTLSGDMAFRLKWGDEPNFLLSVGGFHPAYTPPPLDLPTLERITINLLGEDDPRLTLTTYFAITSNTVQFGAGIDFYFGIIKNIEVVGNLGFDVLIQFSPFYLNAELYASLSVLHKKEAVMAISLYGMLEGPAPWHAQGKAEFTFLKLKLKASFDKTFGEEKNESLPDIEVMPLLMAEGKKNENWEGVFPSASNLLVSLKKYEAVEGEILSHPNGSLRFSQKVVPLDMRINKFGKQVPSDYNEFSVSIANEAEEDFDSDATKEFFAPAEFIELSDTQKLTRKSFEKMKSGVAVSGSDAFISSFYLGRKLEYEHVLYDNTRQGEDLEIVAENQMLFNSFSRNNASARSSLGSLNKPISNFTPNKVSLKDDSFTIADLEDLSLFDGIDGEYSFDSEAEAYDTLGRIIEENPGLADKIDVVPTYEFA